MKRLVLSLLVLLAQTAVFAEDFDVAVIGAGTAGIPAALAAARCGARTVLIERSDSIGGTMTRASVEEPGYFQAWGRQVIDGPAWELVSNACVKSGFRLPKVGVKEGKKRRPDRPIRVKGRVYASLAQIALNRAGVEVRTNCTVVGVFRSEYGWRLACAGRTIEVHQIVDCTGNASVAAFCGAMREREAESCRPGSYCYVIDPGCDLAAIDAEKLSAALDKAVEEGAVLPTDCIGRPPHLYLGKKMVNEIPGADNTTVPLAEKANRLGQESMNRMLAFFKAQPGLEKAKVIWRAKETGVRETYRIVGDVKVTALNYLAGRYFDDAVSYSFYPGKLDIGDTIVSDFLLTDVLPTVPFGCLVPAGTENVLVAGRAASCDRAVHPALCMQATCMSEGQVAGAAAALAARRGVTPRELPLDDLRELLSKLGSIVPERRRL